VKLVTKAAVLYQPKKPLRIEELTIPALRPGQVLVRIAVAGFCRSQLNEIMGLKGPDRHLPHTLGHEGAGEVMAVGSKVRKVKKGDRVVLTWIRSKGHDVPGTFYKTKEGKTVHSGAVSTFLESAVVSENRVVPIPDRMPFPEAALLGCAVLTGAGMVFRTLKVKPGQSVAVFGAGGVGLSAILAASLAGARSIVAVDVSRENLLLAKKLGASRLVRAQNREAAVLRDFDYAIEASGDPRAMERAFSSVQNGGGVCLLAGNPAFGRKVSIDPLCLIRGKRILGSWGGDARPDEDIPRYVKLYSKKKLNLSALIGAEYALDQINRAVSDFRKGMPGRVLIRMQ
jgi:S-(hydroxymethyl)glutathione dehydrogenase/alcohol dehydrogenase